MSNRVDFVQSKQSGLSLPAATVSVFYDGSLCPWLEPIEIVRSGRDEFGWARLSFNPSAYAGESPMCVEAIEAEIGVGRPLSIRLFYNECGGSGIFDWSIFEGRVEGVRTRLGASGEFVEVTARDCGASLKRVNVFGRRVVASDGSSGFLSGLDTVFNPEGQPNASAQAVTRDGRCYRVFSAELSQARAWRYGEAIHYLLCEYMPAGVSTAPGAEQLLALTGEQVICNLDVTGLTLAEALGRCCEGAGLEYKFVARDAPTGPRQAIVFYKPGRGRSVELNFQRAGEQLCISETNVAALEKVRDIGPVTHRYIGQGDFKVYESTFELVKAWDSSLEDTDYDRFSASGNAEFYKVKDVYRKWCLNEAGDYSGAPYNRGPAYDFSGVFAGDVWVRRRRRFWPALTRDAAGRSVGYFLEVSYDDGAHWRQYLFAFDNLLDECGVWLSSDRLDINTWVAAVKGVLRFRITASVVGDERLSCEIADGLAPVVTHIVREPSFRYQKVCSSSIFFNSKETGLGVANEVDDSAGLYEFIRKRSAGSRCVIETTDVATPELVFDFQVGDRVTTARS